MTPAAASGAGGQPLAIVLDEIEMDAIEGLDDRRPQSVVLLAGIPGKAR